MTSPDRPRVSRLDVTAAVLAGGDSTRFGASDKALAAIGDRPMLARVVDAIRRLTDERTLVAVRSADRAARYREALAGRTAAVRFVLDDDRFAGPLAGLAAVAGRARTPWLFVCGCDQPLLDPGLAAVLADSAVGTEGARTGGTGNDRADVVVPETDDGIHPLGALYRRLAVERALADPGEVGRSAGIRALFDRLSVLRVDVTGADPAVRRSLWNVNTETALDRVRRVLAEEEAG